jgi:hypothetical protein
MAASSLALGSDGHVSVLAAGPAQRIGERPVEAGDLAVLGDLDDRFGQPPDQAVPDAAFTWPGDPFGLGDLGKHVGAARLDGGDP